MNREIKFRGWHHGGGDPRVEGSMTYSYPFPIIFWKQIEDEVLSVEVMQYTGLKDKNGKEIYEGDIVEIHLDSFEGEKQYIGPIVFDRGSFGIDLDNQWIDYSNIQDEECIEIIGNIFENPELIKDK